MASPNTRKRQRRGAEPESDKSSVEFDENLLHDDIVNSGENTNDDVEELMRQIQNGELDLHELQEGDERLERIKSNMSRKDRRRLANRLSARRARLRRMQQVETLEEQVKGISRERELFAERLSRAESELVECQAARDRLCARLMQLGVPPHEVNEIAGTETIRVTPDDLLNQTPETENPPQGLPNANSLSAPFQRYNSMQLVNAPSLGSLGNLLSDKQLFGIDSAVLGGKSGGLARETGGAVDGLTTSRLSFVPSVSDFLTMQLAT